LIQKEAIMKYAIIALSLIAFSAPSFAACITNIKFGVCETVKGRNNGAANDAREAAREAK